MLGDYGQMGGTTQGFLPTGVSLWVFLALSTPAIWGSQTPTGEQGIEYVCLLCTILRKPEKVGHINILILR